MSLKSEGEAAGRRAESYLETVDRLEPSFAMVDRDAALTSIAISLRRIADHVVDRRVEHKEIWDCIYGALEVGDYLDMTTRASASEDIVRAITAAGFQVRSTKRG